MSFKNLLRFAMTFKNLLSAEENLKTYLDGKNNHRDDVSSALLKIFELEKNKICSSCLGDCKIKNHQIRYYVGEEENSNHTDDSFFIKEILIKYLPKISDVQSFEDNHIYSVANDDYFITGFDLKQMSERNQPVILSYTKSNEPYFKALSAKVWLSNKIIDKVYFNKPEWINDLKYLTHCSQLNLDCFNDLPDNNWIIPSQNYVFVSMKDVLTGSFALTMSSTMDTNNVIFVCENKTYGISYKDFYSNLNEGKEILYSSKMQGHYSFMEGTIKLISTKDIGIPHLVEMIYSKNAYENYKNDLLQHTVGLIPMSEFNSSFRN